MTRSKIAAGLLLLGALSAAPANRAVQIATLPDDQKLKSQQIVASTEITQSDMDAGQHPIPGTAHRVVIYSYRGELAPQEPNEIIEERTPNSRLFREGNEFKLIVTAGGPQYVQDGPTWTTLKYATTTPEAFDLQTAPLFGQAVHAFSVGSANDDATERSDDTNFDTTRTEFAGRSGAVGNPFWYSAQRFPSITIAKNSTINTAKITWTASVAETTNAITDIISAEASDNAVDFATNADIVNRAITTATVSYSLPTTRVLNTAYDSSDISTVIQEIVNRASWASGNAIMIINKPNAATAGEDANYFTFEGSAVKVVTLTITFTAPSSATNNYYQSLLES